MGSGSLAGWPPCCNRGVGTEETCLALPKGPGWTPRTGPWTETAEVTKVRVKEFPYNWNIRRKAKKYDMARVGSSQQFCITGHKLTGTERRDGGEPAGGRGQSFLPSLPTPQSTAFLFTFSRHQGWPHSISVIRDPEGDWPLCSQSTNSSASPVTMQRSHLWVLFNAAAELPGPL